MIARIAGLCVLLSAWVSFPALVAAQDYLTEESFEKWKEAEFAPLKKRVDELEQRVERVNKNVRTLERKKLVPVRRELEVVKAKAEWFIDAVNDQNAILGDIAKGVSQGGVDKWIPDIRRAQANPEFRRDMADAVHDSMRQWGTLRVQNHMGTTQRLLVNGEERWIPPYASRAYRVPVGTLTTELAGYESAKHWTIAPPKYELQVDIRPKPARPVYVAPRVIVDPIYVGPPMIGDWIMVR